MSISEERQSHLAHVIVEGLWKDDLVDYTDEDFALRLGKKAVVKYAQEVQQVDAKARQMVESLKRGVPEGSPEWEVLYRKYFEQELDKRGIS